MEQAQRRGLLVSRTWVQAVILVVLVGFFILGLLAYRQYQEHPPVPTRVVGEGGRVVFTGRDVSEGQKVFLQNGLMQYGSAFGHGAYLGPDFTADYLRRASDFVRGAYGGAASDTAARRTVTDFRRNRLNERTGTLTFTAAQAAAFEMLVRHYSRFFSDPTTRHGLRPDAITDPRDLRRLTAFFAWTAWAGVHEPAGARLLLHQQLAARAACGQRADGGGGRLVGAVADRAAGRHRAAVRRVRALGRPARLARPRAGDAVLPRAR